ARAQTGEEIRSFAADLTVGSDGVLNVTERIDYFFPGPRHGIYRDIPTLYVTDDGRRFRIPLSGFSVTKADGSPWRFEVQSNDVGVRVKIGDPNLTVSGDQAYIISYRASGALRYFSDHDELYWNATGNDWTVPIRRVTAIIKLPSGVPSDTVQRQCFTGAKGSTSHDCLIGATGGTTHIAAAGPLTVVVGWPPGFVAKLEAEQEKLLPVFVPYLWPLLVGAIFFVLWWKRGRDIGGRGTVMVQYEPPEHLSPAEVGVLMDQRADIRDITSTIVDLAVRGYIKIREIEKKGLLFKSKDYELVKMKDFSLDAGLKPHEKKILEVVFGLLPQVSLSSLKTQHAFHLELSGIKSKLYGQLVAAKLFPSNPETVKIYYGLAAAAVLGLSFFGLKAMLPAGASDAIGVRVWVPFILTVIICAAFVPLMPRRTPEGMLAFEHAKGFKDYLATAEKYRLQWQEKEHVFEMFLPYAMVLGVADKWAKTFADLGLPPPKWYEGSGMGPGAFNAAAFVTTMHSLDSSVNAAMVSAPSQSSGGSGFGGGSSGGGGGGGGGGSW
ncbi:DUF2207 domain-containing protein, partial [Candidatus Uhrbacteria bacterium]|nr:DUF2207 domain-containing protein [Candidatus Uhrbacteria bacterium]